MAITAPTCYGGFQDTAEWLEEHFGESVTRQQVYIWWKRRDVNGFPERTPDGFWFPEVEAWLHQYWATRKRRQKRAHGRSGTSVAA